jgi:2-oxoglutarate dehydrogenase E1 component
MEIPETLNADYIDAQYRLWKADANSVSRDWQFFFQGFEIAAAGVTEKDNLRDEAQTLRQSRAERLIYRYRDLGHLLACLDPLAPCAIGHPLLDPEVFNLSEADLDMTVYSRNFFETGQAPLRDVIEALKETYCGSMGVEYMHIQDPGERRWLQDRMETVRNSPNLDKTYKLRILDKLYQSVLFEQFLNKKYRGQTRFSLEGADGVIPALDVLVAHGASLGCREIILGMAHRGRLNVQCNVLQKPYTEIFGEFETCYDPQSLVGSGDVKYHNGYLADVDTLDGRRVRIFLVNNPSHLESVDPVVEGFARARQELSASNSETSVLPLLIHGDAAFAGQGIVSETLNLSQLKGYTTGGTIHIVINNQIGYTTLPEDARSTRYSTDVAKMLMAPVFHVHGEDPEAAVHAVRLAVDYRWRFKKDVVVDVVCYRRYGHNEGDEPYYTQPRMYDRIKARPALSLIYSERLIDEGLVEKEALVSIENKINICLEEAHQEVSGSACLFPESRFYENWEGFHGNYSHDSVRTGVARKRLVALSRSLNNVSEKFSVHTKLAGILKKREAAVENGEGIDWANAEALAFASILTEGLTIRLSGQDCGRGTFSQRHSVLVDTRTEEKYVPLNHLEDGQAAFSVYDSLLAEASVLGFEYGYAMARPDGLVLWEAQFGDFVNNAQAVIDLYIVSGESKWQRLNGLVMLLPHGLEGLGPEHSSARPERFLQLCAGNNIQICNPTLPSQYFHLLRRQAKSDFRKPLVVLTPKSLLRHPLAVSTIDELSSGSFQEIIDESTGSGSAQKIVLCSGKIYYDLIQRREELKDKKTAIIRVEQLYPFPDPHFSKLSRKYRKIRKWCWVQEEPQNMGAWSFMGPRIEAAVGKKIEYIGRAPGVSPATGFPNIYKQEQAAVIDQAIGRKKESS